jgi:glycosyltransferase involved in cell wall biosynthesis
MKIFYIHNGNFEDASPSSTFIMNRVKGLIENEYKVVLIVGRTSDESTSDILQRKFNINEIPSNLKVYRISAVGSFTFFIKILSIFRQEYERNSVLYTRALGLIPWLYLLKKITHTKLFFENHDFFFDLKKRNDIRASRRKKHSLIERVFFKRINGMVCVNQSQVDLYQKYLSIPLLANHCGIPNIFPKVEKHDKTLAYVGSIDERKGIDKIINLMQLLDESYQLIIFGGKNKIEIDSFMTKIKNKGLGTRIKITGWINKEELNNRLQHVSLGLIPLEDLFFNRYLTYPLKVSDYFSHGIPILTNDYETAKSYLIEGETGFYVDWDDLESTKSTVDHIFKDTGYFNGLVDSTRYFASKNQSNRNSIQLVEFFNVN